MLGRSHARSQSCSREAVDRSCVRSRTVVTRGRGPQSSRPWIEVARAREPRSYEAADHGCTRPQTAIARGREPRSHEVADSGRTRSRTAVARGRGPRSHEAVDRGRMRPLIMVARGRRPRLYEATDSGRMRPQAVPVRRFTARLLIFLFILFSLIYSYLS